MSITSYQRHKVKLYSVITGRGVEVYAILFAFDGSSEVAVSEPRLVRIIAQKNHTLALSGNIASTPCIATLATEAREIKTARHAAPIVSPYISQYSSVQFFARPPNC